MADHRLAAPTCSRLNQTNLIVYTVCAWLLAVMPIHSERPLCYSLRHPGASHVCVEIKNSFCFLLFYSFLDLGIHMCEAKPAHLQTWHLLGWIRIFNLVRVGRERGQAPVARVTPNMNCDLYSLWIKWIQVTQVHLFECSSNKSIKTCFSMHLTLSGSWRLNVQPVTSPSCPQR